MWRESPMDIEIKRILYVETMKSLRVELQS